jgi:hypothetical protein
VPCLCATGALLGLQISPAQHLRSNNSNGSTPGASKDYKGQDVVRGCCSISLDSHLWSSLLLR